MSWIYRPDHPLANENGMVEKHLAGSRIARHGEAAYVISDSMEMTRHMADGKYYSSKAKFRQVTKAHGCVEVGNDPSIMNPKPREWIKPRAVEPDIKRAIEQLRSR